MLSYWETWAKRKQNSIRDRQYGANFDVETFQKVFNSLIDLKQ